MGSPVLRSQAWAEAPAAAAIAGAFEGTYGGSALSPGVHVLVELRGLSAPPGGSRVGSTGGVIAVLQPNGTDTRVRVAWDESWAAGPAGTTAVGATPVSRNGTRIGATERANVTAPSGGAPGFASFLWTGDVGGQRPWAFVLQPAPGPEPAASRA